jgi:hypothetical protein
VLVLAIVMVKKYRMKAISHSVRDGKRWAALIFLGLGFAASDRFFAI